LATMLDLDLAYEICCVELAILHIASRRCMIWSVPSDAQIIQTHSMTASLV
jgi:hypothetical protein